MLCTVSFSLLAKAGGEDTSRRYMAVKTNIAFDAIAIHNLDFGIGLSEHITLDIPLTWSFWNWKQDLGLRVLGTQPRVAYWFRSPGEKHAAGIDAGMYFYNLRYGDYRYQDYRRPLLCISLNYTYALRLSAQCNIEFSLSVGYANTRYNRYYNIDNGAMKDRKTLNYFGPTQAAVNLCYIIGR